ncbi:MAG: OmpH family outer membrane protein [Deltaproteobacteria bacterium]|nr:OmpH family outer membrane protein [Deltaproteobacteria bacterium]
MKKMSVFVIALCAAVFFFAATPGTADAKEPKIAIVNLVKALNESDAGIKAKEELKGQYDARNKELQSKEEELKKLKEEYDQKAKVWKADVKAAKEKELRDKSMALEEQLRRYSDEINRSKTERENAILMDMKEVIEKTAKEEGYDFIFDSSLGNIPYFQKSADITDKIVSDLNKKRK